MFSAYIIKNMAPQKKSQLKLISFSKWKEQWKSNQSHFIKAEKQRLRINGSGILYAFLNDYWKIKPRCFTKTALIIFLHYLKSLKTKNISTALEKKSPTAQRGEWFSRHADACFFLPRRHLVNFIVLLRQAVTIPFV